MLWARFGHWCAQRGVPLMSGLIYRHLYRRFGLEIAFDKAMGGGLYIAHTQGCVLSFAEVGENCTVISAVTIGRRNKHAFPVLGDNVLIGAGARVLGGIKVGDNARIGANAVVLKDVPADSTAIGIPAKIVQKPRANGTLRELFESGG